MDLTPAETALVELLRAMGAEPLHLALTSAGAGVALTIVTAETGHVAGWGDTFEEAMTNAYTVPTPDSPAAPQAAPRFAIVAGTDRQPRSPRS